MAPVGEKKKKSKSNKKGKNGKAEPEGIQAKNKLDYGKLVAAYEEEARRKTRLGQERRKARLVQERGEKTQDEIAEKSDEDRGENSFLEDFIIFLEEKRKAGLVQERGDQAREMVETSVNTSHTAIHRASDEDRGEIISFLEDDVSEMTDQPQEMVEKSVNMSPTALHRASDEDRGKINFLEDDKSEMTLGRRIALKLMQKSWYFPNKKEPQGVESNDEPYDWPSLERAWAYFEHVALERYIVKDDNTNLLERAEPGEKKYKTRLYNPVCTPHGQVRFKECISCILSEFTSDKLV